MKTAMVCWRPYQLFNAVRYMVTNKKIADDIFDLYIVDIPAVHDYIERVIREKCFTNVYVLKELSGNNWLNRIRRTVGFLFPKKMILKHLCVDKYENIKYDRLISSGWHHYFVDLCEINSSAEIILLEDGTITYIGDERKQPYNYKKYKLMFDITKKGPLSINVSSLYINNINLLENNYDYPVVNMPEVDEKCFGLLSKIFSYSKPEIYNNRKTVYLTQPLSKQFVKNTINNKQIIEIIKERKKDIVVRRHPAELDETLDICQDNSKCSWELLSKDIDDSWTLIGVFSSAQLIPAILYNSTPNLVFTYRLMLLQNTERYREIDDFVLSFADKYKGKIYIPNTLKEFDDCLNNIEVS